MKTLYHGKVTAYGAHRIRVPVGLEVWFELRPAGHPLRLVSTANVYRANGERITGTVSFAGEERAIEPLEAIPGEEKDQP